MPQVNRRVTVILDLTSELAVNSIRDWWKRYGLRAYGLWKRLLILRCVVA
jgi:hypothetical protein